MESSSQNIKPEDGKKLDSTCQAITSLTEAEIAFYLECAEKSGLTIEEWLALEPF